MEELKQVVETFEVSDKSKKVYLSLVNLPIGGGGIRKNREPGRIEISQCRYCFSGGLIDTSVHCRLV